MSDASPERHWTSLFAATAASRAGEPAWLEAARKAAIARFAELGFPTRRLEEWKYTNPAAIAKVSWQIAERALAVTTKFIHAGFGSAPLAVTTSTV